MAYREIRKYRGGDPLRDVVFVVFTKANHDRIEPQAPAIHEASEVLSCGHLEKIRSYFGSPPVPQGPGRAALLEQLSSAAKPLIIRPKYSRRCSKCRRGEAPDVIGIGTAADADGAPIEAVGSESKYRVVGKFVGGCDWESNETFPSPGRAWTWWAETGATGPTRSVRVRVVPAE